MTAPLSLYYFHQSLGIDHIPKPQHGSWLSTYESLPTQFRFRSNIWLDLYFQLLIIFCNIFASGEL
jgi:hypothetical protein